MIRPGPLSLDAGLAPGGVVVRCYAVANSALLFEQRITPDSDVAEIADAGGVVAAEHGGNVCLVAFDGDSGERYDQRIWALVLGVVQ